MTDSPAPLRIALLSEMLQPYRIPVFNRIAEIEGIDFTVLLLSLKEANRQWEIDLDEVRFEYRILPSFDLYVRALDYGVHLNRGIVSALRSIDPHVVAGTGYTSPSYLSAQRYARKSGAGYVLWSGSTQASSRIGKSVLRWAKQRFVQKCDASLAYGSAAKRALLALGASEDRVIQSVNTVDVGRFAQSAAEADRDPSYPEWRAGFPERNLLFVGQMIPRKGVVELVESFETAGQENLGLILIGDGPEFESYKERFCDVPNLFWEGYRQSREMGRYYRMADALVMPSALEVWGLVVNEAMASGLPVIATSCSGATEDLIVDGETGYAYDSGDGAHLTKLLVSVAGAPDAWARMGAEAARRMRSHSPEAYAQDFVRAARLAHEIATAKAGQN